MLSCSAVNKDNLEKEIVELRKKLEEKEEELRCLKSSEENGVSSSHKSKLSKNEIARYSRQMIIPDIGVKGQLALKKSSVLIVGAGGLGCPAAMYLAGAGVGHIGIVDYDEVELNNLHRQPLHYESNIGETKVSSAAQALHRLNSAIKVTPYHIQLNSTNALDVIQRYDVVIDASDNVPTRYLLNDACVLLNRPLVSGSALRLEGQFTVYNYGKGPCYRCLFPSPPKPDTVTNCSDGGVLGSVPGVIGVLQALETTKILCGFQGILSGRLIMFDGMDSSFRNISLRQRNPQCAVCGENPTVTSLVDYEVMCMTRASDKDQHVQILSDSERISPQECQQIIKSNVPHMLIDVRQPIEFEMCHIDGATNFPMKNIKNRDLLQKLKQRITNDTQVIVVCRRGNDSQKATVQLRESLLTAVKDIRGGLHAWAREVDPNFPVY